MSTIFFDEYGAEPLGYIGGLPQVGEDDNGGHKLMSNFPRITIHSEVIPNIIHSLSSTIPTLTYKADAQEVKHDLLTFDKLNAPVNYVCGQYLTTPYEDYYLNTGYDETYLQTEHEERYINTLIDCVQG